MNLKELRLGSEDLIKEVMPGAGGKDDGECVAVCRGLESADNVGYANPS